MAEFPEGYLAITPYFTVPDADTFIAFAQTVFDATLVKEDRFENGRIQHARLNINGAVIMLNEASPDAPANTSQMHLYVESAAQTHATALKNGGRSVMDINLRPHGEMMAGFVDPSGNIWWIAEQALTQS